MYMNFRPFLFSVFGGLILVGCQSNSAPPIDFTVSPLKSGPDIQLSKDYKGKPVVVYMWATWCGPCRQIAPLIDELAVKYEGSVVIGKVNVDEQPDLAQKYGINAIPTLLLFKDGEVVERFQGVPPRSKLEASLDSAKA